MLDPQAPAAFFLTCGRQISRVDCAFGKVMDGGTTMRIEELLRSIPGTIEVAWLDARQALKVVELEALQERASRIPIRNIGVRLLGQRDACLALLKDARFRPPKVPTVYLVEEAGGPSAPHTLVVEGARYRVVGEEVIPGSDASSEVTISLEGSFVIYPDRRTGPGVPCSFILPPIGFQELEADARELGITDILSVSPSLASDGWIRSTFGFSPSNAFATLLVGCNFRSQSDP